VCGVVCVWCGVCVCVNIFGFVYKYVCVPGLCVLFVCVILCECLCVLGVVLPFVWCCMVCTFGLSVCLCVKIFFNCMCVLRCLCMRVCVFVLCVCVVVCVLCVGECYFSVSVVVCVGECVSARVYGVFCVWLCCLCWFVYVWSCVRLFVWCDWGFSVFEYMWCV